MRRGLCVGALLLALSCGSQDGVELDPMSRSVESLPSEDGGAIGVSRVGKLNVGRQTLCWSEVGLRHPTAADLDLLLLRESCPVWTEWASPTWSGGVGALRYDDGLGHVLSLEARVGADIDLPEVPPASVSPDGTLHARVGSARHEHRRLPEEVTRVELRRDDELTVLEVPGTATVHWATPHTLVLRRDRWTVWLVEG